MILDRVFTFPYPNKKFKDNVLRNIKLIPILVGFLFLFAVGMGIAIYLKLKGVAVDVELIQVVFWQLAIWMPLVVVFFFLQYMLLKTEALSEKRQWVILGIGSLLVIGLHFLWFYSISLSLSPYLGLPKTRYGVYPFFFIFWITIDFILLGGLLIYLKLYNKNRQDPSVTGTPKSFYVKKGKKGYLLQPEEIYWIAAEDYYVKLFTAKGQFLERSALKTIITQLPQDLFVRIHRSTVVNINAITAIKFNSAHKAEVHLKDGNCRTISRTYLKPVRELLKNSHF